MRASAAMITDATRGIPRRSIQATTGKRMFATTQARMTGTTTSFMK